MAPMQKTQKAGKAAVLPKRTVCNTQDYLILVEYLEDVGNFAKLFGSGKKTAVGGKYLKRGNSWDVATVELKAEGFQDTNGKNLYKKWQRYFSKYREAKRISNETGGGLTDEEIDRGLTLEDKLNNMCEHFHRMDELMGHRVNVEPPAISGLMGFESFGESSAKKELLDTPVIECINLESPSSLQEQHIEPSWMDEREGEEVDVDEGGLQEEEQVRVQAEQQQVPVQQDEQVPVHEELPQQEAPSITKGPAKQQKKNPTTPPAQKDQSRACQKKDNPALKPTLATVYQERKIKEAQFKLKAIKRKEVWKMAEIQDMKDARIDDMKKRKVELEFELEQKRFDKEDVSLEAHRERAHRVDEAEKARNHEGLVIKRQAKADLVKSGWAQNKSQAEIDYFLNIIYEDC